MKSANSGYGICGAKNVYSSRTKLDNWVEDEIGVIIASHPRPPIGNYETVAMSTHCHPSKMPVDTTHPAPKMPSTLEMIAKNKEGTPYSLLFGHGQTDLTPDERYNTMARVTMMNNTGNQLSEFKPLPAGHLHKEKAKQAKRDIDLAYKMTTEMRAATSNRININRSLPLKAYGPAVDLPIFKRQGLLTSTFPTR